MKISIAAAMRLKTAAHNYLDECYIGCSSPHPKAAEFHSFICNEIDTYSRISKFIKESIKIEIPRIYAECIYTIIGD